MDDPPLMTADLASEEALAGVTVEQFARRYEKDLTALRAALLALSMERAICFRHNRKGYVVLPFDPQRVGHSGRSIMLSLDYEAEEHVQMALPMPPPGPELPLREAAERC